MTSFHNLSNFQVNPDYQCFQAQNQTKIQKCKTQLELPHHFSRVHYLVL